VRGAAVRVWTASRGNCQEFMCHMKAVTSRAPKTKKDDGKEEA